MQKLVMIAMLIGAPCAIADDISTLKGETFRKATVTRVEPDGITVTHEVGVAKIPFTDLPKETREKYNYDPERAAAYARKDAEIQNEIIQLREKALAEAQKRKLEMYKQTAADLERTERARLAKAKLNGSSPHRPVTDADLRAAGVSEGALANLHRVEADTARYHGGGSVIYSAGADGVIYRNGIPIP